MRSTGDTADHVFLSVTLPVRRGVEEAHARLVSVDGLVPGGHRALVAEVTQPTALFLRRHVSAAVYRVIVLRATVIRAVCAVDRVVWCWCWCWTWRRARGTQPPPLTAVAGAIGHLPVGGGDRAVGVLRVLGLAGGVAANGVEAVVVAERHLVGSPPDGGQMSRAGRHGRCFGFRPFRTARRERKSLVHISHHVENDGRVQVAWPRDDEARGVVDWLEGAEAVDEPINLRGHIECCCVIGHNLEREPRERTHTSSGMHPFFHALPPQTPCDLRIEWPTDS